MAATQQELEQAQQAAHAAQQKKADMVKAAKVRPLSCNIQSCNFKLLANGWLMNMPLKLASCTYEARVITLEYCIHTPVLHCTGMHGDSVAAYCYVKVYTLAQTERACLWVACFQPCLWYMLLLMLGTLLAMHQDVSTKQHASYAQRASAAKQVTTAVTGASRRYCQFWLPEGAAYQGCTGQAEGCQGQPGSQQEDCQGRCTETDAGQGRI